MRLRPGLTVTTVCCLALVGLVACARIVPVPEPGVTASSDRHGTMQETDHLLITVRVKGWRNTPYISRLQPYVTPLYLQIRNTGDTSVPFSLANVVLVDQEDTLYRPLSPERLEALLRGSGGALATGGIAGEAGAAPWNSDLAATLGSLTDGDIPPDTQMRGALYFPQQILWADTLTLRLKVAGAVREFHFRVR